MKGVMKDHKIYTISNSIKNALETKDSKNICNYNIYNRNYRKKIPQLSQNNRYLHTNIQKTAILKNSNNN